MAEVGAAWQNGEASHLMRAIKEEEVDFSDDGNYADAVEQISIQLSLESNGGSSKGGRPSSLRNTEFVFNLMGGGNTLRSLLSIEIR